MNLQQSVSFSILQRSSSLQVRAKEVKTPQQVSALLAGHVAGDPMEWLASKEFVLLDVPVHYASTPFPPSHRNDVLVALRACAAGAETGVVIDLNVRGVGKIGNGFMPSVIVLHGQAAVEGARLAGRETVRAWVGKLAAQKIGLVHADHQLSSNELSKKIQIAHNQRAGIDDRGNGPLGPVDYSDRPSVGEVYPMENYHIFSKSGQDYKQRHAVDLPSRSVKLVGKPQPVKQKYVAMNAGMSPFPKTYKSSPTVEQAALLNGMGTSGPPYNTGLGTQPAANRTVVKAAGGYIGYPGATAVQRQKNKGAPSSEMSAILSVLQEYHIAVEAGYQDPEDIQSVAPPGMEHMVKGLKKKFGEKSSKPFAIAWWKHNQQKRKK